ncbi:Transcriptional regulator, AraC family protein [Minicystis rosea]|nr:Transcriptional regulator, AraC family protein [Minicystis rosea]
MGLRLVAAGPPMSMPRDATTPAAYALQLLDLAARWNVSERDLLEGLDLRAEALAAPGARITYDTLATLLRRTHELTGEPGLAVYMGRQMRLSSHGALGLATMTARSVGDALHLVELFLATRSMIVDLHYRTEEASASLVLEERGPLANEEREFAILSLVVMFLHIADVIAEQPLHVLAEVTSPEPAYVSRFPDLARVRFSMPVNRLVFRTSELQWPLKMADPVTARLARDEVQRELAALGAPSEMIVRVRQAMHGEGGFRSLDEVAQRLHVSTRTLKRRLADAGTSFTGLLDEVRRDKALLLVDDHRLSLEAVAIELGYFDVANFVRAFRRWTGKTPSEYRHR